MSTKNEYKNYCKSALFKGMSLYLTPLPSANQDSFVWYLRQNVCIKMINKIILKEMANAVRLDITNKRYTQS